MSAYRLSAYPLYVCPPFHGLFCAPIRLLSWNPGKVLGHARSMGLESPSRGSNTSKSGL
jgi:hypothetical protein